MEIDIANISLFKQIIAWYLMVYRPFWNAMLRSITRKIRVFNIIDTEKNVYTYILIYHIKLNKDRHCLQIYSYLSHKTGQVKH
jgi:hypothetical protein